MILSVSRRTDIPTFYSDWFLNRIRDGVVYTRNPMNRHQVSRIRITPDVVDCIVFWTKNPIPMLSKLEQFKEYHYYFHFTLTGYEHDFEGNLPDKRNVLVPAFKRLSSMIGKKRVIWRYDPIVFNEKYTMAWHLDIFNALAKALDGYTEKCVISFVDIYRKNARNMRDVHNLAISDADLISFSKQLHDIATSHGLDISTCAEAIDFQSIGISHNACIDKNLIEDIIGMSINVKRDPSQRTECGCVASIDVGSYNTCKNGCRYCYANFNPESVAMNASLYNPESPILCDKINQDDRITDRKVKSLTDGQLSFSDILKSRN